MISREPNGKNGFEAFGAREIGGDPDFFECGEEFGLVVLGFGAGFILCFFTSYDFKISEAANGVLAVETAVDTEFIEDFSFFDF